MTTPRLYYTLPDLAAKWHKSENDLLHMAAAGALVLSVYHLGAAHYSCDRWNSCYGCGGDVDMVIEGYVQLDSGDCKMLLKGLEHSILIGKVYWEGRRVEIWDRYDIHGMRLGLMKEFGFTGSILEEPAARKRLGIPSGGIPARDLQIQSTADLLILPAEVARVESKFPELNFKDADQGVTTSKVHEPPENVTYREGQKGLLDFFGKFGKTPSWNTIKRWIEQHEGYIYPHETKREVEGQKVGRWRISEPDADNIRRKHQKPLRGTPPAKRKKTSPG